MVAEIEAFQVSNKPAVVFQPHPMWAADAALAFVCPSQHTYLYDVIIKQQPKAMALHDGDIMSTVWTTAGKKDWRLSTLVPPKAGSLLNHVTLATAGSSNFFAFRDCFFPTVL